MTPIEPEQFEKGIPMPIKCPKCGKGRIKAFKDKKLREKGYLQLRCLDCGHQWLQGREVGTSSGM